MRTTIRPELFELDPQLVNRRHRLRLTIGSATGDVAMTITPGQARSLGTALLRYSIEATGNG